MGIAGAAMAKGKFFVEEAGGRRAATGERRGSRSGHWQTGRRWAGCRELRSLGGEAEQIRRRQRLAGLKLALGEREQERV
jgi:hypothetical protein